MNRHDLDLIEVGQKEGYERAIKKIVEQLRESASWYANNDDGLSGFAHASRALSEAADDIEREFQAQSGGSYV